MICYKGQARDHDPVMDTDQQERLTTFWSHPLIGQPENLATGLSFTRGGYVRVGGGVPRSSGTYSEIPKAIWADPDGPGDLEGVATGLFGDTSPESIAKIAYGNAVMGTFTRGKGAVFNAGTTDWAYGLDSDPLVQRVTANILRHLSSWRHKIMRYR